MSGGSNEAPTAPASGGRFANLSYDRDSPRTRENGSRYGNRSGYGERGGGTGRDIWRGGSEIDRKDREQQPRGSLMKSNNEEEENGDATSPAAGGQAQDSKRGQDSQAKNREPEVRNSRAAALSGGALERSPRGGDGGRRREPRNEGPPPVRNSRFERMAEEEREKQRVRKEERGPPPVANSRFAAAAEADRNRNGHDNRERGPPPIANSRFAAAAEADRSSYHDRERPHNDRERGPPPMANSRFAAAAEADRSSYNDRDRGYNDRERGPPPIANSRFAAAAEADRRDRDEDRSRYDDRARLTDRGPPPVANSRFAAAAEADRSNDRPRENDRSRFDDRPRYSDRGPPPVANSRFANAAAWAEQDNREREERRRDRYGSRDRFDGARSRFDPRYVEETEPEVDNSRVEALLQQSKKKEQERVLEPKTKEHEANMFQFPAKALTKDDDDFLSYRKKEQEAQPVSEPIQAEKETEETKVSITEVNADTAEDVMKEFVHGGLLGEELKAWCDEKRLVLPTVEKLLGFFLVEHEKLNPDPDCAWADPEKYGAALVSIVDDDVFKQMQVLWAIQEYCDGLGFPSYNDESVVQSMFRSMYKYDLAEGDAFDAWKQDESEVHEKGKMTTIMQTMDWFNWLEEDDDDDEEDGYY